MVWALVVGAATLLWGCAVSPTVGVPAQSLSGRLALQVYAAGAGSPMTQQLSAGFEWTGDAQRGQLELFSPLGTVVAQARWSEDGAWWQSSPGSAQWHASPDELAEQALGQRIPLAAVFAWLQARPWPQAPHRILSSSTFEQLGWRVDLSDYAAGRVGVQRLAPPLVTLKVQLHPGSPP